ncbi:MAG: hypothetical protein O6768_07565 [Planctomycetota bacterium]|nr:hypothetical protein [Planctomycetota bacterium]
MCSDLRRCNATAPAILAAANLTLADISGAANVPDGCVEAFDLEKLLAAWCSALGGNPCGTCF